MRFVAILEELERIIEPYKLGLAIVDVNFLPARPPEEVKDAFDDAIAAQEDEQRFLSVKPKLMPVKLSLKRGEVERMAQQANAYKEREILEARGKWPVSSYCCLSTKRHLK